MIKHISVTQEDIDKGKPLSGDSCPVYFAIERECKWVNHVAYEYAEFVDQNEDTFTKVWLPEEVNAWITEYDYTGKVKPFEFDLDIPDAACS